VIKTNTEAIKAAIDSCELHVPKRRPWLLFDADSGERIRARGAATDGLLERVERECREIMAAPVEEACSQTARSCAGKAAKMAEGYYLLGEAAFGEWSKRQIDALLEVDVWMAPVHGEGGGPDTHADHVMTNIAACVTWAHDLLGDTCDEAATAALAEGIRRHCLLQFLFSTRTRAAWWAWEDWRTNWKIMCCGETGFSVCAFADRWPEAREALWLTTRGVIETLDAVPPEGDWEEGVTYWFTTLFMGLRFATALRRLTGGAVNLFEHPALARTGDYAVMTTTPGGRLFNFNDNADRFETYAADGLLLLATETGNREVLGTARRFASGSPLWLALDDPEVRAETPERTAALFPFTGVATMRSGWGDKDTFVGFKASPSKVSHGHLDANSFVLESGGASLLIDEGTWPYGIGYHEIEGPRWNWDALATIGHNCLLIDGRGQSCGGDYGGRIISCDSGDGWDKVVGDAAAAYPGLAKSFVRTVLLIHPDVVIVRDLLECEGQRHAEWLLHYAGGIRSEGVVSIVENEGVSLAVTPLLPDRSLGWRVSDVNRTSIYVAHSSLKEVTPSIRYRSFSPFRRAERFEFLFAMRVGGDQAGGDWRFAEEDGGWSLTVAATGRVIRPSGREAGLELT